jgi:hypothetical protein
MDFSIPATTSRVSSSPNPRGHKTNERELKCLPDRLEITAFTYRILRPFFQNSVLKLHEARKVASISAMPTDHAFSTSIL